MSATILGLHVVVIVPKIIRNMANFLLMGLTTGCLLDCLLMAQAAIVVVELANEFVRFYCKQTSAKMRTEDSNRKLLTCTSLRKQFANCAATSAAQSFTLGNVFCLSDATRDLAHNKRVIIAPSFNIPINYAAAPNAFSEASAKMCNGIDYGRLSFNICRWILKSFYIAKLSRKYDQVKFTSSGRFSSQNSLSYHNCWINNFALITAEIKSPSRLNSFVNSEHTLRFVARLIGSTFTSMQRWSNLGIHISSKVLIDTFSLSLKSRLTSRSSWARFRSNREGGALHLRQLNACFVKMLLSAAVIWSL